MENLQQHIEALLFASEQSITVNDIKVILTAFTTVEIAEETIVDCLATIQEK